MGRSQRHLVETVGYCSRGTTIAQGGLSPAAVEPKITDLAPTEVIVGEADIDVTLIGTFSADAKVFVDGVLGRSTFVNPATMIVTLQPSTVASARTAQITVVSGWYTSNAVSFNFVEPPPPRSPKKARASE